MKSLMFTVALAIAALAGPVWAQTSTGPAMSSDSTAAAAPLHAQAAHDPNVEVAFWEAIQTSDDPMLYLAYLEQFPDGAFRVIARNRLDDLWDRAIRAFALLDDMGVSLDTVPGTVAAPVPAPAPAPVVVNPPIVANPPIVVAPTVTPVPQAPSWQLIRNTQNQLRRHGCYKGAADGVWGERSKAAMRTFNQRAGTTFMVKRPTPNAINRMRELTRAGVQICR